MQALIFNTSFELVKIVDEFDSFIWTDRYSSFGDFEMYLAPTEENLTYEDPSTGERKTIEGCYILTEDSDHGMIIEDIQIDSNVESGPQLYISGRSLESILDRRIIWRTTIISGNLQKAIKQLLDGHVISPSDPKRRIENFIFEDSTDEAITSLKLSGEAQFTGDNLYDVIVSLCDIFGIGFRITLSADNKLVFKLYAGVDRSYSQTTNPYVVFSPDFENLLNSSYLSSKKNLKTITLVAGEGEGSERKTASITSDGDGGTGLNRRELYTDARDISQTVDGATISDEEYNEQLAQRGKEKLAEHVAIQSFEGESDMESIIPSETLFK